METVRQIQVVFAREIGCGILNHFEYTLCGMSRPMGFRGNVSLFILTHVHGKALFPFFLLLLLVALSYNINYGRSMDIRLA